MTTIYQDGTYRNHNPSWHAQDSPWKARQILRIVKTNDLDPSTVCEIGCGAGEILSQLAQQWNDNTQFSGYEISPQAFELCQTKAKSNVNFFLRDLLEETELFFDLILAIDVIEHVEDYYAFLRKLRAKGQYKIFHIPLDLSAQTVLRGSPLLRGRESVGHIHYFTRETALATLKDTGYEIVDWFYTSSRVVLSNLGFRAGIMRIPRKLLFLLNKDLASRILGGFSLLVLAQ